MTTIPIQNVYYLLSYAWNKLDEAKYLKIEIDGNTSLQDLFSRVLLTGVKILLKRGLYKSYVENTDEIPGMRGKLQLSETVKRASHLKQRTVCTYDEYSADILVNQIMVTTLQRLRNTVGLEKSLNGEIKKVQRFLPLIPQIKLRREHFIHAMRKRTNQLIHFVMDVCWLVFENSLPADKPGLWIFKDFTRDEHQMSKLFETFIRRFYEIELKRDYVVKNRDIKWKLKSTQDLEAYLPRMRTDITLETAATKIIIDAKFYQETMSVYYNKEKIKSANLYQLFAYLLNQEDGSEKTQSATGILLYPTVHDEYDLDYLYQKHNIYIKTVNLNEDWKSIDRRLRDIVFKAS